MSKQDPTLTANQILAALNGYNLVEAMGILAIVQQEMYLVSSGIQTEMSVKYTSEETH